MRGEDERPVDMFSSVRLEERVPADHPLRGIRALCDAALAALDQRFAALYSRMGRPSIRRRCCCARPSFRRLIRCAPSAG